VPIKRLLVVCALVLLLACTGADARASATRHTVTTVHLYAPFNGGGIAADISVARTASGYCWTTSGSDVREDAFRCFVANFIYDPCFANQTSFASYVLCPLYTPLSKVLRINLTRKLPLNAGISSPTRYPPWAVRTTSGKWCTILTGATGQVARLAVEQIEIYDTSTPFPVLLAGGPGGRGQDALEVIHPAGYAAFLEKGAV
jgi:hypothetical protein